MSVVVRMEMPKDCPMCPMAHWNKLDELTGCEVAPGKLFEFSRSKEYRESNTRPDWCPIICQLPEMHGRLVDADKLADDMKARKAFFGRMSDQQCLVEDARTIVPEERREE